MKKLVVLLLVIAMSLAVFACTKIEETRVEPIDPNGSENAAAVQEDTKFVDKLSFVKDGEIYFDLHVTDSIKGFKVTVDGKEANKAVPFTANSVVAFEGEGDPEKSVYAYIVYAKKDGKEYTYDMQILNGLDADKGPEMFGNRLSNVIGGNDKLFVSICDTAEGWDHSLSESLNTLLLGNSTGK